MRIQPIQRMNVSEQVFQQMKGLIFDGEWKPGDRLPSENDLAATFGVSRVTVRQAIHRLVALELAETHPGDGTYIRGFSPGQSVVGLAPAAYLSGGLTEVFEFRKAIEGYTAELAAQKATEADIARLEEILDEMAQVKADLERFSSADYRFHHELAVISRNPLILESYNLIADVFRSAMRDIVEVRGSTQGLHDHRAILDSIRVRNADECRSLMTRHIDETHADMLAQTQGRAARLAGAESEDTAT